MVLGLTGWFTLWSLHGFSQMVARTGHFWRFLHSCIWHLGWEMAGTAVSWSGIYLITWSLSPGPIGLLPNMAALWGEGPQHFSPLTFPEASIPRGHRQKLHDTALKPQNITSVTSEWPSKSLRSGWIQGRKTGLQEKELLKICDCDHLKPPLGNMGLNLNSEATQFWVLRPNHHLLFLKISFSHP
jgi:hypothetical protein